MNYYGNQANQLCYYEMIVSAGAFVAYKNAILNENLPGGYKTRQSDTTLQYTIWKHRNKLLGDDEYTLWENSRDLT